MFHHDFLGFRVLFPYISFLSFLRKRIVFHRDFLAPSGSGLGFRGLSPFFSFVSFLRNGAPNEVLLRMNVVETWFVAVWGLCWCNLAPYFFILFKARGLDS